MFSFLRKFCLWLLWKTGFGVFLAASALAVVALWLFVHDEPDFVAVRARHVASLQAQQVAARTAMEHAAARLTALQLDAETYHARADKAGRIIEDLQSLERWWRRWITDREQQKLNTVQIQRLNEMGVEAERAAKQLMKESDAISRDRDRHQRELRRLECKLQLAEMTDSPVVYYLSEAWWLSRWFVLAFVGLYYLAPTIHKIFFFYVVAPRVAHGRPIRLVDSVATFPWLGETHTLVETVLWPGEVARVKRRYLENVDDGIVRSSHYLLSWRFPLTSLLIGFSRRVNLRNVRAGRQYSIAFADHKIAGNEMAIVHVPEGGSLVVRPSYLAGVVYAANQKFGMRSRWQLFRWQSWVTGQFRYIEFTGPCRLVIAGRPGLHAERLAAGEGGAAPAYRTPQDAILGFTPNLDYRLVRTMRFWNYYRGKHLLFDACFVGVGFVMTRTERQRSGRLITLWWFAVRDRTLKLFGL